MPSRKHTQGTIQAGSFQDSRQNLNIYVNEMYKEMMSLDGIKTNDKTIKQLKENRNDNKHKHKRNINIFLKLKNFFRKWLKRK